jgi:hypothetical protein
MRLQVLPTRFMWENFDQTPNNAGLAGWAAER